MADPRQVNFRPRWWDEPRDRILEDFAGNCNLEPEEPVVRTIAIVNQASTVTGADAESAVAAVQAQLDSDFAPIWGGAKLVLAHAPPNDRHDPSAETVYVLDDADQAGALGYHTLADTGVPVGFVFARTARADGEDWSITLSHEVLEQLADPWASYVAVTTARDGRPVGVALEVCDACEGESYPRQGAGQPARPVSDFVYPSWFRRGPNPGQLDFLNRVHAPLQLLRGGYIPVTADLHTWSQIFGEKAPARRQCPHHLSRVGRRVSRAPMARGL